MRGLLALGAVTAALVCSSSISAAADDVGSGGDITLQYVQGVAHRFEVGGPTAEDEAFAEAHPDIAANIVDGRLTTTGGVTTDRQPTTSEVLAANPQWSRAAAADGGGALRAAAAAKVHCHSADRYQNAESTAHVRLFSYHTTVDWCENGKSITSSTYSDYFSNIQGASMTNPQTGLIHRLIKNSAHQWIAYTGGSIDNCILKIGCLGTWYPANQVVHYAGQGNYTFLYFYLFDPPGWQAGG